TAVMLSDSVPPFWSVRLLVIGAATVVLTRPKPMPAELPATSRNGLGGSGGPPCAHRRPRPVSSEIKHAMTSRMQVDEAVRTQVIDPPVRSREDAATERRDRAPRSSGAPA